MASIDENEKSEILSRLKAIQEKTAVIDPTANVLGLVAAANLRQDDLRRAENRRLDDLMALETCLTDKLRKVEIKAATDLANAESKRIDALALAESRRIDAVQAEQKNAVALAAEKTAAQAATLAAQVVGSAEALRAQVATTAATSTALITQLRDSLEKRIQIVEQNQYLAGGASAQRVESRGTSQWTIALIVTAIFGIGGFLIGLVGLGLHLAGK
jgi:hypothetical protein